LEENPQIVVNPGVEASSILTKPPEVQYQPLSSVGGGEPVYKVDAILVPSALQALPVY
jgi:hypothetical protein